MLGQEITCPFRKFLLFNFHEFTVQAMFYVVKKIFLVIPRQKTQKIGDCNKVREVARRRTLMFDDGGMNDETSATV